MGDNIEPTQEDIETGRRMLSLKPTVEHDPWIESYSGAQLHGFKPSPDQLILKDIAHSLSNICRYNGHVRQNYTVAQHCVHVAELLPEELAGWGLMHDAAESFLGDCTKPLKKHAMFDLGDGLVTFDHVEGIILFMVSEKFDLPWPIPQAVDDADKAMLRAESRDLMRSKGTHVEHLEIGSGIIIPEWTVAPWAHRTAKEMFLDAAKGYLKKGV